MVDHSGRASLPGHAEVPTFAPRTVGAASLQEAELADSIGLALLVVLETLTPAERLAFVLHDMFAVPFDEIAGVVGTTTTAARQLASRARRRVQGTVPRADTDMALQRRVVDAFLRAARAGDFDALVAVLAPDVVFRVDTGRTAPVGLEVSGADAVARSILSRGNSSSVSHTVERPRRCKPISTFSNTLLF